MTVDQLNDWCRHHWPALKEVLLSGKYVPSPVRKVEIPKPDGGMRTLDIPTVIVRLIQQALNQALTPHYDPTFSASSFGYRPKRSAHQALDRAKEHIGAGHRWVVDVDLEKFFDRVNHDVLMSRLAWLGGTGILLVPCHLRQPASHGSVSDASDSQLALRFAASKSTKSFALDTLPRLGQTLDALGPRDASLSQCAL